MTENEAPGEWPLPDGWEWTTIGSITQPIEKVKPRENPDVQFTYLDISSIDNTVYRIVAPKTYQGAEAPSRARQLVEANDVLFSTVRTYLRNIALVPEAYDGQIASTGFSVLRAKVDILPKYLFYYSLTDRFVNELGKLQRGTSYPAVRDGDIRVQPFPLAPLPEQRRIVAEIETQFTRLDAGVAALERAQANLKRYRASVLKAACGGWLVPTEAELHPGDYEPADQLLARILAERRARWEAENPGKKYKELAPPDTEGLPELPEGWVWATAEQCTSRITDGEHITPERAESGVLLLSARNVQNGYLSLDKVDYVPEYVYEQLSKRLVINPGDVLMSCSGTVGRSCVAPPNLKFALVRSVAVLKPLGGMGSFLSYAIRSPMLQMQIDSKKTQTAQANIFQGKIKTLVFSLPPLAEQRRIVAEVERRLSVVAALEAEVEAALVRAARLRQSILKRAFEGRLVPQDPNDEPASALLARIKAEREMGKDKSSGKKKRKPEKSQQLEMF